MKVHSYYLVLEQALKYWRLGKYFGFVTWVVKL